MREIKEWIKNDTLFREAVSKTCSEVVPKLRMIQELQITMDLERKKLGSLKIPKDFAVDKRILQEWMVLFAQYLTRKKRKLGWFKFR